jgi:hypothetical protein
MVLGHMMICKPMQFGDWKITQHFDETLALEERSFAGRANSLALLSAFLAMQVGELPGCALGMPENF